MRQRGREMQSVSLLLPQGPSVWWWRANAQENDNNTILLDYWRKTRQWAHLRWSENSSLLLSHPVLLLRTMQSHQHPTANKVFMPTHALVQRHHTSWTRGRISRHAHTVTASADTSWDIRLVRVEYKQEEAGTFFLKKASNLFVFFFFFFLHYPMCRVC